MDEISNKNNIDLTRRKTKKTPAVPSLLEHGRIPPQAIDLEEAVLGAIMLETNALTSVIDLIKPEVFYKDAHQQIFKAILDLFTQSERIDLLTVTNQLKKNGTLEQVGGPYYIAQLTNRIASAANIEAHTKIILQKFIKRELIRISSEIIHDAFEESIDVFDMLDTAEKELFAISEKNLRQSNKDLKAVIRDAINQIKVAQAQEGHISGIPSGFTELDRVTAGWQRSDLIILAARPGMGKTALVLSMARNIAVDFKKPIAIFSLEMAALQLVMRLISSETELSADKLKRGALESYEWEQLNSRLNNLLEAPIFIDDTPALSVFELRAKCRRLKAQHNIDMIIIDYLQLMSSKGDNAGGTREQEISNISRSLKSLAKELDVPIIAISQLSRAVETRGGSKRPILSDLRESGAIEQDADMVLFIYRPEYYKIETDEDGFPTKGTAEIIIAKHRNGALRDIKLRFIDQYAKFLDLDLETTNFNALEHIVPPEDFNPGAQTYTLPSKMNNMNDEPPF